MPSFRGFRSAIPNPVAVGVARRPRSDGGPPPAPIPGRRAIRGRAFDERCGSARARGLDRGALLSGSVAATQGPGPLAPVHRITIVTAFLGALAYLAWELNQLIGTGDRIAGLRALLAAAVVVGIGLYLRNLRARLDAKLRPSPPPGDRPAA